MTKENAKVKLCVYNILKNIDIQYVRQTMLNKIPDKNRHVKICQNDSRCVSDRQVECRTTWHNISVGGFVLPQEARCMFLLWKLAFRQNLNSIWCSGWAFSAINVNSPRFLRACCHSELQVAYGLSVVQPCVANFNWYVLAERVFRQFEPFFLHLLLRMN